jgi:triosephosphate isomerase
VIARCRPFYGGSVKPDSVKGLMALPDIDGASLTADSFPRLVFHDRQ